MSKLYALKQTGYQFNDAGYDIQDPRLTHVYKSYSDAETECDRLNSEYDFDIEWYDRKEYEVVEIEEGLIEL